jgi:hypothetical protein
MTETPIRLVFMGNLSTRSKIAEVSFSSKSPGKTLSDIEKVFSKICQTGQTQSGIRNKLSSSNGSLIYYSILSPNIFYLANVENTFPEHHVFGLFESIHKKELYIKTNDKGELSNESYNELKEECEKKQNLSKNDIIYSIEKDISEVKTTMHKNLSDVLASTDDARDLQNISNNIKIEAFELENNASELKKQTCWQDCKWTIIAVGGAILLALIILIPILT